MLLLLAAAALAAPSPAPPRHLRALIRDTQTIVRRDGSRLWPGFGAKPFQMILVHGARETLFCHAQLPQFTRVTRDPITGCAIQSRRRVFDLDVSTALDFADQPAMIVFGTPRHREEDDASWVIDVGHEAFHQYQFGLPDYAAQVAALGLAPKGGDGSWMLDYPFPYQDAKVAGAFATLCQRAGEFLAASAPRQRRQAVMDYLAARHLARATVSPTDWRYYEFQVGQEGVARWTQVMLAQAAARREQRFANVARERLGGVATSMRAITRQGLGVWKRSAFYELGAAEAMMLDAFAPKWREVYRERPFSVGEQLDALRL